MAFDFPDVPTVGQASNGYTWDGAAWTGGGIRSGLPEAPLDNILYGRQMGAWVAAVKITGDVMTGNFAINKAVPVFSFGNAAQETCWAMSGGESSAENFSIRRYVGGQPTGTPILIEKATGVITMEGVVNLSSLSPVVTFVSTGADTGTLRFLNGAQEYWKIAGDLNNLTFWGLNPGGVLAPVFVLSREFGLISKRGAAGAVLTFQLNTTTVGSITTDGVTTSYNISSSADLKTDLRFFDPGAIIDAIKVYDFAWADTGERAHGVIAQEAIEVYPPAVTHTAADWWGVDYSKYVSIMLQELKLLRKRVRQLEAERSDAPKSAT